MSNKLWFVEQQQPDGTWSIWNTGNKSRKLFIPSFAVVCSTRKAARESMQGMKTQDPFTRFRVGSTTQDKGE